MKRQIVVALLASFFSTAALAQYLTPAVNSPMFPSTPSAGQFPIASAGSAADWKSLSGDATLASNGVLTLSTVNTNVGSFGSATNCVAFTTNGKGLITAASATTCTPAIASVTGLGTGVATALAVNIGTAGSFITNGGALGSPSSAGTIPAFTLGGTISGGGNQINNVIIGTSTPLAGSFTTVTTPVVIGGSGTTSPVEIRATSGAGTTSADVIFTSGTNGALEMGRFHNTAGVGFFGINKAAPNYLMQINAPSGTNALLQFTNATTGSGASNGTYFGVLDGVSDFRIAQLSTTGGVDFLVNGAATRAMYINASGGVTVGAATDAGALNLLGTGAIRSNAATSGVGYATGAGGAVTQITNRNTGVTLNTITGAITLVSALNAAVSGATANSVTVTDSAVAATDVVHVVQKSGTDLYEIFVTNVAAGSFKMTFFTTGGTSTESPVFNFAVIKGVAN